MAENRELALVLKLVADEFQKELKNSQGALSSFSNFIKDWRTQLAAAGTALFAIAKSTANYGDDLFKTSQKVGIQVEALAGLRHAASLADVDNRQLQVGLQALSRAMVDSAQGTGEGMEAFKRVGLSAVDAGGKLKPMQDVLLEVADVFSLTEDGAGKTEVAMKLFGKSGVDLIPLLNSGKASIQELMAEAERLGLVMSEKDAAAAEAFNDQLTRLDAQAQGFALSIGTSVIPILSDLLKLFQDLGSGPVGKLFKLEMQGLSTIFTLLGHAVKEVGMEIDVFFKKFGKSEAVKKFWDDVLVQSRKNLDRETDKRLHQIFQNELGLQGGTSVQMGAIKPQIASSGGKDAKKQAEEQEKLGRALLDIYQSQNNALDIRNKLEGGQGQLSEFFLAFDRQQQFKREDEAEQVRMGNFIVSETQRQVRATEEKQQRERDGLVKNLQAWIDYDNQVGASTELRYEHQLDLLRANLAQQLQITTEDAGQLLAAWENVESQKADAILNQTTLTAQERETIELQSLTRLAAVHQQFSGNIWQGWTMGLQRYLADTQSAFGFAADMARRTAQMMESAFRTFFFDLMDGKIKSLKDVFNSFANFAKQVIAQVMAQLAVMAVMKGISGGFGGFGLGSLFGGGGGGGIGGVDAGGLMGLKFAAGGPVLGAGNQDSVRALLTPGEGVLNRRGMDALGKLNAGQSLLAAQPSETSITINIVNSGRTDRPTVSYRREMKGLVMDLIYRDHDVRQMLMQVR